jgi:hypothetical protein
VISDRDKIFTSSFWETLMKMFGSKLRLSSSFHPQTDGATERANRTLIEALTHFAADRPQDWPSMLPLIEYGLNSQRSATTLLTPFEADLGYNPRGPLELAARPPPRASDLGGANAAHLAEQLSEIANRVIGNTEKAKAKMAAAANAKLPKTKPISYNVGDWVWLDRRAMGKDVIVSPTDTKLSYRFTGPFKITSVHGVAVRLELPEHLRQFGTFNFSRIKKCRNPPTGAEPVELSDGSEGWLVEKILKRKTEKGRRLYLIKWKDFPDSANTYEPLENLADVRDMVDEFEKALEKRAAKVTLSKARSAAKAELAKASTTSSRPSRSSRAKT